jgi:hypothetical protein
VQPGYQVRLQPQHLSVQQQQEQQQQQQQQPTTTSSKDTTASSRGSISSTSSKHSCRDIKHVLQNKHQHLQLTSLQQHQHPVTQKELWHIVIPCAAVAPAAASMPPLYYSSR